MTVEGSGVTGETVAIVPLLTPSLAGRANRLSPAALDGRAPDHQEHAFSREMAALCEKAHDTAPESPDNSYVIDNELVYQIEAFQSYHSRGGRLSLEEWMDTKAFSNRERSTLRAMWRRAR